MDFYFAAFNSIARDRDKARRIFNQKYGAGSYRKHIAPYVRKGIMGIFRSEPTRRAKFYVNTLAKIVNERIGE